MKTAWSRHKIVVGSDHSFIYSLVKEKKIVVCVYNHLAPFLYRKKKTDNKLCWFTHWFRFTFVFFLNPATLILRRSEGHSWCLSSAHRRSEVTKFNAPKLEQTRKSSPALQRAGAPEQDPPPPIPLSKPVTRAHVNPIWKQVKLTPALVWCAQCLHTRVNDWPVNFNKTVLVALTDNGYRHDDTVSAGNARKKNMCWWRVPLTDLAISFRLTHDPFPEHALGDIWIGIWFLLFPAKKICFRLKTQWGLPWVKHWAGYHVICLQSIRENNTYNKGLSYNYSNINFTPLLFFTRPCSLKFNLLSFLIWII